MRPIWEVQTKGAWPRLEIGTEWQAFRQKRPTWRASHKTAQANHCAIEVEQPCQATQRTRATNTPAILQPTFSKGIGRPSAHDIEDQSSQKKGCAEQPKWVDNLVISYEIIPAPTMAMAFTLSRKDGLSRQATRLIRYSNVVRATNLSSHCSTVAIVLAH